MMTAPILKEFYQTDRDIIALVMTAERRALQAWRADCDNGRMERMDALIMDVLNDDAELLGTAAFQKFCDDHAINPAIPERSIQLSYKLAASSMAKKSNTVPAPARHCSLAL